MPRLRGGRGRRPLTTFDVNRRAWDVASRKYLEESDAVLAAARTGGGTLLPVERELLAPMLAGGGLVVHLQSGNATDDFALVELGATTVLGVDFSVVAVEAAERRARESGLAAGYVTGDAQHVPLRDGIADVVYTGKGALMWLADLAAWAAEVRRLLQPGGSAVVVEAHPAAPLWTRDADRPRLDDSVDYFGGRRKNTSFPASAIARFGEETTPAAIEQQWPLSGILMALLDAGLTLRHIGEHAEPFWRPADGTPPAAAWAGRLPNTVSIVATA